MKKEAASAGVLDIPFGKFARLQIVTIEDLFAGKKPAMPPEDSAAFKRAAREEDKTRQAKQFSSLPETEEPDTRESTGLFHCPPEQSQLVLGRTEVGR